MEVLIDVDAKMLYPTLKVAIASVSFDNSKSLNDKLLTVKKALEEEIKAGKIDTANFFKYNKFYKKFSSKVPMEFQLASIKEGKEIPTVNPLVTCMFMAELKNIILTAGHDLEKIGAIQVSCAKGTETYFKINKKEQILKKNDIFAISNDRIISSVLHGPDNQTKVTNQTKKCLFMSYAFGVENLKNHLMDILTYLKLLDEKLAYDELVIV